MCNDTPRGGYTFLDELRASIAHAALSAVKKSAPAGGEGKSPAALAEEIAISVVLDILYEWGGNQVYVPNSGKWLQKAVAKEFTGSNQRELTRKYRLAHGTVDKYIKKEREENLAESALKQARLPGMR